MSLTGNVIEGWQVDERDFIIVPGEEGPEEIEVHEVWDNGSELWVMAFSQTTNIVTRFDLDPFTKYPEWGE